VRILVADDEPAVRDALARALRLEGYDVDLARDGEEALAAVGHRPDAVVLDVLMPNLDGISACRRLRALGDRTPVLMLTARDAVSDRVAGLDAGADDYLVKPFALEELLARLRALLRRSVNGAEDGVLRFGARRLRGLPAPQAGGGGRDAARADGARRRLRAPRAMTRLVSTPCARAFLGGSLAVHGRRGQYG
jgi:DNA-binding response OmpR family regulator